MRCVVSRPSISTAGEDSTIALQNSDEWVNNTSIQNNDKTANILPLKMVLDLSLWMLDIL